jgi:hypothetical protein
MAKSGKGDGLGGEVDDSSPCQFRFFIACSQVKKLEGFT